LRDHSAQAQSLQWTTTPLNVLMRKKAEEKPDSYWRETSRHRLVGWPTIIPPCYRGIRITYSEETDPPTALRVRWAQPKHERFNFAVKKVLVALHCRSLFSAHFTLQGGGRGCELYPMQCRFQSTLRRLPNRAAHHISATRTCVHSATIHHYQASVLLSPGSRASPCAVRA
jgi:hypothetical protein